MASLTACAPLPHVPGSADPALTGTRPPLGPALQRFVAEGRLALHQGRRQDHVRFRWQHAATEDNVLFLSPLGQGLAEIQRNENGAQLIQPHQPAVAAESLPALAQHLFGTPLPLDALVDWLRGARPEWTGVVDGWQVEVLEAGLQPVAEPPLSEPSSGGSVRSGANGNEAGKNVSGTAASALNNAAENAAEKTAATTTQTPGTSAFSPSHQRRLLRKVRVTREEVVLQVIIDSWEEVNE